MSEPVIYPSYVICVDGEPLVETDGTIVLYQEGDDDDLKERFLALVYLSYDSSTITIKKFDLIPRTFENSISKKEFIKKAQETRRMG
jgi:hypothetical protein